MTRKDYELLASAVRTGLADAIIESHFKDTPLDAARRGAECVAEAIAVELGKQSRGFDRELFLRNAGFVQ